MALLGDSYVAALSVPLADTLGRRLEAELARRSGRAVEVVALGRPGWGQADELRVLQRFGRKVRPDLVLTLVLTFNDLRDNSPELDRRATEQLARIAHFRPGWTLVPADRAPLFWIRGSRLNQLVSHRLAVLAARGASETPIDYLVYETPPAPEWLAARDETGRLLAPLAATSRGLGARFAVATASTPHGARGPAGLADLERAYPGMRGRAFDFDQPDRWIAEICARTAVPYHALQPEVRAATAAGRTLHWPYDGHWNHAGNTLAAELLAPWVASLLPPPDAAADAPDAGR